MRRYLSTWCRSYIRLCGCGRHHLSVLHRHDHLAKALHQLTQDSSVDIDLLQCMAFRNADPFYRFHGDPQRESRRLSWWPAVTCSNRPSDNCCRWTDDQI